MYIARFQEIAMHCHLSEYSIHTQFVGGLKPHDLDQLYQLAIDIDGHQYKMKKHLRGTPDSGLHSITLLNPHCTCQTLLPHASAIQTLTLMLCKLVFIQY